MTAAPKDRDVENLIGRIRESLRNDVQPQLELAALRARVAALEGAVQAERERCAKVCEKEAEYWERFHSNEASKYQEGAERCAAAIRSGGESEG
jgi:hypothetical protein